MGIDDVPIMALTLSSQDAAMGHEELTRLAHSLETELKTIAGTRDIYTLGEHNSVLSIRIDPSKMNGHNISFADISQRLQSANSGGQLSTLVNNNELIKLQAGNFLKTVADVENLIIGSYEDPTSQQQGLLYLGDIASVSQIGRASCRERV